MLAENQSVEKTLERRSVSHIAFCEALVVADDTSYAEADRKVSESAALEKGVKEYWAEAKKSTYVAWKSICTKENQMLEPIKKGGEILVAKMANYRTEREAVEQKKREEEQERNKAEMQLKAFELAEQGVPQEAVDAVMEMADEPVSIAPKNELRGKTSFSVDYEVRVIKGKEHLIPREVLEPTTPLMVKALEAKVKVLAKASGGKKIEGIEITQTTKARRRATV